jgi:TDG/mug DNA glycosylase family protein
VAIEEIEINGERIKTLKELTRGGLKAIFVGMNPSPISVELGHYYQGAHGRRVWKRLIDHLVIRLPLHVGAEDKAAFAQGFGFADLIRRPTISTKDLGRTEKRAAVEDLLKRLKNLGDKPTVVFTYKEPWELAEPALTRDGFTVLRMPGPYTKGEVAKVMMQEIRRVLVPTGKGLQHYLDMIPNVPPDPGDELPEG